MPRDCQLARAHEQPRPATQAIKHGSRSVRATLAAAKPQANERDDPKRLRVSLNRSLCRCYPMPNFVRPNPFNAPTWNRSSSDDLIRCVSTKWQSFGKISGQPCVL